MSLINGKTKDVKMKYVITSNDYQYLMCPRCKNGKVTPRKMKIDRIGEPTIICAESEQKTTQGFDISDKSNTTIYMYVDFYCESCESYSRMRIFSPCSQHDIKRDMKHDAEGCRFYPSIFEWVKPVYIDEEEEEDV